MPEKGYFVKTVNRIEPRSEKEARKLRVAAYARVSMASELSEHSLAAQISYYSGLIQRNPAWEFAGIYADNGISGTGTKKRAEFNRMLAEAEAGKIDIILTKSIQRFARNTVDLLNTVRRLKELGVEVRFERERIHTLSGDGKLMLSILASFAEEESRCISENISWSVRKKFEQGRPWQHPPTYGYRWKSDDLILFPEEAEVVKRIYNDFLNGKTRSAIARELNAQGLLTIRGGEWRYSTVSGILTNYTYTGNLLLHKTFRTDPITKQSKPNCGELPQYQEGNHEAIIPMEQWEAVQKLCRSISRSRASSGEIKPSGRRALKAWTKEDVLSGQVPRRHDASCFTSKLWCQNCGCALHRVNRKTAGSAVWICGGSGKRSTIRPPCPIPGTLPQPLLEQACAEALGLEQFDEEAFLSQVSHIDVTPELALVFYLNDGREIAKTGMIERKQRTQPLAGVVVNREKKYAFSEFLTCGRCGALYTRTAKECADGSTLVRWRCTTPYSPCRHISLLESRLQPLTASVLGIPSLDRAIMEEQLDHATVEGSVITYFFRDGKTESVEYTELNANGWTPDRKARQAKQISEKRR